MLATTNNSNNKNRNEQIHNTVTPGFPNDEGTAEDSWVDEKLIIKSLMNK